MSGMEKTHWFVLVTVSAFQLVSPPTALSGDLYGLGGELAPAALLRIDPVTGIGTAVELTGFPAIEFGDAGLAYDRNENCLYALNGYGGDTQSLLSIDLSTFVVTERGPLNHPIVDVGLAFDPVAGTLYAADETSDQVFTLDTSTGHLAPLPNNLGINVSNIGLAFDHATSTLWGVGTHPPTFSHSDLFAINTTTGRAETAFELPPNYLVHPGIPGKYGFLFSVAIKRNGDREEEPVLLEHGGPLLWESPRKYRMNQLFGRSGDRFRPANAVRIGLRFFGFDALSCTSRWRDAASGGSRICSQFHRILERRRACLCARAFDSLVAVFECRRLSRVCSSQRMELTGENRKRGEEETEGEVTATNEQVGG